MRSAFLPLGSAAMLAAVLTGCGGGSSDPVAPVVVTPPIVQAAIAAAAAVAANDAASNSSAPFTVLQGAGVPAVTVNSTPKVNFAVFSDGAVKTGLVISNVSVELRLDLVHQRSNWADWTWAYNGVPFTYSDGATVGQQPRQNASFVGLRYVYKWL